MKIYGFHIYADDRLVSVSKTFYPAQGDVLQDLRNNVHKICSDIANEVPDMLGYWDENFDPKNTQSCDEATWVKSKRLYDAVQHVVKTGCVYGSDYGIPCDIEYHIILPDYEESYKAKEGE